MSIEKTPGICDGRARIGGTRITVATIDALMTKLHDAQILMLYPGLDEEDLDDVRLYAAERRAEIDADALRGGET